MSFKDFLRELAVEIAAFVAAAAFIVVVAVRYSGWAALVGSVLLIAFSVYKIVKFFNIRNRERQLRDMASHSLDATDAGSVNDFPMPMLVCDGDGIIELFNRSFSILLWMSRSSTASSPSRLSAAAIPSRRSRTAQP